MVFSSIYNAFLFGEFAVLMMQMGSSDEEFQKLIDSANGSMISLDLSEELQNDIRYHFITNRESKKMKEEFVTFTDDIST